MIKLKIYVILFMCSAVSQHVGKYSSGSVQHYLDLGRDFPPKSISSLTVSRFHIPCRISSLPYIQESRTIS